MELNRNQFFFLGLVILMIGLQFRVVSAYVLNAEASQFIAERTGDSTAQASSSSMFTQTSSSYSSLNSSHRVVHPPEWLGWCLISVGAVLILHSLAMPRPV